MNNDQTLTVHDLSFAYREKNVLQNINFSVNKGDICGLLGPNGSGKTTLLKCINGILGKTNGSIKIHEKNISSLQREEIAKLMAVVPQELHLVFSFTVLQVVVMGGGSRFGLTGTPKEKDYLEALEVLEELGVPHLASRIFNELSGGEKQIVLIAKALFQKPHILLLDEPISHLDFKKQYTIMELIKKITRGKNLTTLITLHDPNIAGRYCNKLVMLKEGNIVYQGSREDVFHAKSLEAIYDIRVQIENTRKGGMYVLPAD